MKERKDYKEKFKHDYGMKNVYQFYKEKYDKNLSYAEFSKILNLFNLSLIEEIYKGAYIKLPYSLGSLFIYKYKPVYKFDKNGQINTKGKYKMVDHKATKAFWEKHPELKHKQRIMYNNFHTDGYKFKITWKRYDANRLNKVFNFRPSRGFKRGLAKYLKEHPNQSYYDK